MKEKIGLQDLAALLADKAEMTKKDAETFLREYFELMNEELVNSGLIKIKDLGAFKLSLVEDRESIDVTTGERVLIPSHNKVVFSPDRKLSETVNEPFAFFETTELDDDVSLDEIKYFPEKNVSAETESSFEEEIEEFAADEPTKKEEVIIPKYEPVPYIEKEKIIYEYKPAPVEEEIVFNYEPTTFDDEEVIIPVKEPVQEEDSSEQKWNSKKKCNNCHEYKSYISYKKRYSKSQKKIKQLWIIIYALFALLLCALGFIAYLKFDDILSFKFF